MRGLTRWAWSLVLAAGLMGCPGAGPDGAARPPETPSTPVAAQPESVVVSVVGTSDLHGHIQALPLLSGYVANLRRAREADGGGVLLVDAGDMFQGTLESNQAEGQSVIEAYDVMGYDAAAVGNHEFDFGPAGPATTPEDPDDDPRGALKERAAEADFPLLVSNILDGEGGARVDWPGMPPTAVVEVAGVRVGIVGVTTEETLRTTIRANVRDLAMAPLAETIVREARRLREEQGAGPIVVLAHAGGGCEDVEHPADLSSCVADAEIFDVARALPPGAVDAIVAAHTHRAIAQRVNGIPIVQSWAYGVAFGRIDLTVDRATGRVVESRIHPPHRLCEDDRPVAQCDPGSYEGAPVERDARVATAMADDLAEAERLKHRPVGVTVKATMPAVYGRESALGDLLADLILEARPQADVALMNGGGIRAPFREGPLTYGELYETFPFDNRFALVTTTVAELERVIAHNLTGSSGFLSIAGLRARVRCRDGSVDVELRRANGRRMRDDATVTVVTSDYIATVSDHVFGSDAEVELEDGPPMREALFEVLRERGGTLDPAAFYDPEHPRVSYEGQRPLRCEEGHAE